MVGYEVGVQHQVAIYLDDVPPGCGSDGFVEDGAAPEPFVRMPDVHHGRFPSAALVHFFPEPVDDFPGGVGGTVVRYDDLLGQDGLCEDAFEGEREVDRRIVGNYDQRQGNGFVHGVLCFSAKVIRAERKSKSPSEALSRQGKSSRGCL